jgi:hypothetical protein
MGERWGLGGVMSVLPSISPVSHCSGPASLYEHFAAAQKDIQPTVRNPNELGSQGQMGERWWWW